MSDIYGIDVGVKASLNIFFQSGRATGRTSRMISMLKPGDVVVFENANECNRVRNLIKIAGMEGVYCEVYDPENPLRYTCQGTCYFDHSLIEKFYRDAIKQAERDIENVINYRSKVRPSQKEMRQQRYYKWEV